MPPRARSTASGAHVSHRLVPKCISATSARPSASARILFPAPPITTSAAARTDSLAAARLSFFESPVTQIKPSFASESRARCGTSVAPPPIAPDTPDVAPGCATPHTMIGSSAFSGNGRPTTPPTALPRNATPMRHCTASSRPSTNSLVPSTGSTNTVSELVGSVHDAMGGDEETSQTSFFS